MTPLYIIGALIFLSLAHMRAVTVDRSMKDWNYYWYKYKSHCMLKYTHKEKTQARIESNEVNRAEAIMVFFMFWKIYPDLFWSHKVDFEEMWELYYHK